PHNIARIARRSIAVVSRTTEGQGHMDGHRDRSAAMRAGGGFLTRRRFLQMVGATAGSGAVTTFMAALGQIPIAAQTVPPRIGGSGEGTKVIVLGAGPGGCPAAWELVKLGYDVTVIEARDRLGGHVFTVRGGSRTEEYGKGEQVCDWDDESMWFDAGPSRIPFFHRSFFHYCHEFNIPLMDHKNLNLNSWVYAEGINGPLNGQRIRLHEMQADMAGHTSELLARAADQDALDAPLSAEDTELLRDYLINWGILSSEDLTYGPSDHRGYTRLPDTQSAGTIADPYPLTDLLPFSSSVMEAAGGYLAATATFDWQTTLVKPVGGVDRLYEVGFKEALGDRVLLNCEVTEIRQSEDGVRIVYLNKVTGETEEVSGDYCVCNIPLSVLIKIDADFSREFQEAIRAIPYAMALRLGLGFNRRFWEDDDWIYGGQSFSNIGELGILDYPDDNYGAQKGVMLGMYNFGTNAAKVSAMSYEDRVERALELGSKIHPQMRDEFMSGFSVAWHLEPYSLGAWPSFTERTRQQYFPLLQEPDGRVYLVGEHLSYVNAWIEGAVQAAWMQVSKLHLRVLSA
ncbi:MAG TPA: flavin monoamine oxidase family protein, partial [Thermomicrobiales bacterium]|nr:flavin monoamine oxidase family protein [Thermomicrobiales bacterium]